MKALSIRQPWAWAILHAGKDIENRDWRETNPDLRFRGDFLIHASNGMTRREYEDFLETAHAVSRAKAFPEGLRLPGLQDLRRGGIVGRAVIVDVVRAHQSPWFFGPFGFVLADVKPLPFTPFKGTLGFFNVPIDIL